MTYAPLTISAIDHTTGTLTIVGHGLVTGGGFRPTLAPGGPTWGGAIFAAPGSGGVLPTGLSSTGTYWPIRLDDDHIKLASSNADAMAGTAFSFSDNGTLPLSFLVGLPYRVPRISAPKQMVFSDDDNTAWQALVALWELLTGQAQSIWNGVTLAGALTVGGALSVAGAIHHGTITVRVPVMAGGPNTNTDAWQQDAGGVVGTPLPQWQVPLVIPDGRRLTGVRARVKDSATGPTKVTLITTKSVDTVETGFGGAGSQSNGTAAWQTLSRSMTETITAGTSYYATVFTSSGTSTSHFAWIEYDFDFLP